jgi:hypothetical protein
LKSDAVEVVLAAAAGVDLMRTVGGLSARLCTWRSKSMKRPGQPVATTNVEAGRQIIVAKLRFRIRASAAVTLFTLT